MIEVINPDFPRGPFRAAVFDFDGTLSLLRRNWQDVMIPMMVEILAATGTSETREQLREVIEDFVVRLTGKQTIYQMMRLADEIKARGGEPLEPLAYKHQYHDLLWAQVESRVDAVRARRVEPAARLSDGRLDGVKTCVPAADRATAFVVTTASGLALVDARAPGVTIEPQIATTGAPHGLVTFSGAPAAALEEERQRGEEAAQEDAAHVAHEDLGRVAVPPQEAHRRPDHGPAEDGELAGAGPEEQVQVVGEAGVPRDVGEAGEGGEIGRAHV